MVVRYHGWQVSDGWLSMGHSGAEPWAKNSEYQHDQSMLLGVEKKAIHASHLTFLSFLPEHPGE